MPPIPRLKTTSNSIALSKPTYTFDSQSSFIFNLPLELREQIYCEVFDPVPALIIQASTSFKDNPIFSNRFIQSSDLISHVSGSIIHTCKQFRFEALPILLTRLHLHVTFDRAFYARALQPSPPCLTDHLSRYVLEHLRHATYHSPLLRDLSRSRHPKPLHVSFPFYLTPSLSRFCLQEFFRVKLDMLNGSENERLTQSLYEGLSTETKLELWIRAGLLDPRSLLNTMAQVGSGRWIRDLLTHGTYGAEATQPSNESDGLTKREKANEASSIIPSGCQVVVEVDYLLYVEQRWQPMHIETLVVEIDVNDKQIRSTQFLKGGAMKERTRFCRKM